MSLILGERIHTIDYFLIPGIVPHLNLVKLEGRSYSYASKRLQRDIEVAKEAMENNSGVYRYLLEPIKNTPEIQELKHAAGIKYNF